MAEQEPIPWQFLSDEAVDQTAHDSFGLHSAYAKLLLKITKTAVTPFCIALYSNWGTGKTSVAKMLQSLASASKDVGVVYLDVWKYSSDPLKRWILLESERQLARQGIITDYKYERRTLQSHLEFEEQIEDESKIKIDFKILGILTIILISAIVATILLSLYLPQSISANGVIAGLIVVASGFTIFGVLFSAIVVELFKAISQLVFRRTVRQTTARPAFSSEKFGEIFHDLVTTATKKSRSRLLFIFDNLDRCSEAVAVEAVSVIKTYLDEPNCVYLIPCDETALVKHLHKTYVGPQDGEAHRDGGRKYAQEFLNKFFQATLRLPATSEFDIEKYLDEQLKVARMDDLPVEARDVLVLGYLGQTPRQIKRVINDLISFRALAQEAEQSDLLEHGTLTGDLPLLTKVSVISVQWPEFLNRLGMDPELWAETLDKINAGTKLDGVPDDLFRFLNATRHVSPNSDVRPFVFLKRFDFEKDLKLSRVVEDLLRKGETVEYQTILDLETSPERQQVIIAKTAALGRQWLSARRPTFLKNVCPLLVKAALQFPSQRQLKLLALDVLEYLASALKLEQLEDVLDIEAVMRLDETAATQQKKKVLSSLIPLFSSALTERRRQSWIAMITHSQQMDAYQKSLIADALAKRFESKDDDQLATLTILDVSAKHPAEFAWGVRQDLLLKIVNTCGFSAESSLDKLKIRIFVAYQDQLQPHFRKHAATSLNEIVQGGQISDENVVEAFSLITKLRPNFFQPDDLTELGTYLVEELKKSRDNLKAAWSIPLFHVLDSLPIDIRSEFETVIAQLISGPADPNVLPAFLTEIGEENRKRLTSIAEVRVAIRTQAEYLERFGKPANETLRQEFFEAFSPAEVLEPDLYDDTRLWDLRNLVRTLERAAAEGSSDLGDVRVRLVQFCKDHLLEELPKWSKLYSVVHDAVKKEPKLLDLGTADILCSCALKLLATDLESYYPQFQTWKGHLEAGTRTQRVRDAISELKGDEEWIRALDFLSRDVANDEGVRIDQILVRELFDHAFAAIESSGVDALSPALNLLTYLNDQQMCDYADRALDTLIAYEANREGLDRMEPFLRLLEAPAARLTDADLAKVAIFSRRLLGPANEPSEQVRAVQFVSSLKHPELVKTLKSELEQLSRSENDEVSVPTKQLLGPS